jgi:starvation-inducible outer membrane lipoprotein
VEVILKDKENQMKKIILILTIVIGLAGCTSDADRASENMSKAADNFEVTRRIVFYNGILIVTC